jgi:hypothetical protein
MLTETCILNNVFVIEDSNKLNYIYKKYWMHIFNIYSH